MAPGVMHLFADSFTNTTATSRYGAPAVTVVSADGSGQPNKQLQVPLP